MGTRGHQKESQFRQRQPSKRLDSPTIFSAAYFFFLIFLMWWNIYKIHLLTI